jgi:hypothetical protein
MPSVVDKASQFSLQHKRYAFTNRYRAGKKRFTKLCHQFNFSSLIQHRRLVYQRSDMPQHDSEEQVFVTRNKRSSASPEPTESYHSQEVSHTLTANSWIRTDCASRIFQVVDHINPWPATTRRAVRAVEVRLALSKSSSYRSQSLL